MRKGQVSFDFILAIIVALIFVAGIQVLSVEIQEMQRASAIRNQEKAIALQLYGIISTANALSDADTLTVEYKTPKLLVPGESPLKSCEITLNANPKIVYDPTGKNIEVPIAEFKDDHINIANSMKCGETLVITG